MAVKLLRQLSETPNISNKDDVKMIRYAYGGYNGILKGFNNELDSFVQGNNFFIDTGRAVIDGWEIDVDSPVPFALFSASGTFYISVYIEVNGSLETATIKTLKSTTDYPTVDHGDDLTEYPQGIARMLLYNLKAEVYGISLPTVEITYKAETIPYYSEQRENDLKDLNDKISNLVSVVDKLSNSISFGEFVWNDPAARNSIILRIYNYAILDISHRFSKNFTEDDLKEYELADGTTVSGILIGTLPLDIIPMFEEGEDHKLFNALQYELSGGINVFPSVYVDTDTGNCIVPMTTFHSTLKMVLLNTIFKIAGD